MNAVPDNPFDWRALAAGALLILGAIFLVTLAALMGLAALLKPSDAQNTLTLFLLAGGMFFLALPLLPGIYLNGLKVFGLPDVQAALPRINNWLVYPALSLGWLATLTIGQVVSTSGLNGLLLPIFNGLGIGFPIVFLLRLSLSGLPMPSARRAWSVFGLNLLSAPTLAMIFECIAFVGFILVFILYALANSELRGLLPELARALQNSKVIPDELALKIMFAPGTLLGILGLFSVAIPIIEEAAKMTALLLCASRVQHPSEGFALGVLCGAAFALSENTGFTAMGADNWAVTVITRASAVLPHMFNCGILGWALISAWKERKYLRLGLAYFAVILVHGTWNAVSVLMAYSSLAALTSAKLPAFLSSPLPASAGWLVLIGGTFGGLLFCNWQMRRQTAKELGYNLPLPQNPLGENHGNPENPA